MELLTPVGIYSWVLLISIAVFYFLSRFLKRYISDWVPRIALALIITIVFAMLLLMLWTHFAFADIRAQHGIH